MQSVVFLPGFMCDARLFAPQATELKAKKVDCHFGDLTRSPSLRMMARDVLRSAPDQFALCGLSMGGIVALEILRAAPERVTHLALLNTTPYADKMLSARKSQLRRVANGEMAEILRNELKPEYLSPATHKANILPLISDMGETLGPDVFALQSAALMTRRSHEDMLETIHCPALVLTGADDTICPPNIHRNMARNIPDARLRILGNCGHLSSLEQPDRVSNYLLDLLARPANKVYPFPQNKKARLYG